jgi:hypothetical protein
MCHILGITCPNEVKRQVDINIEAYLELHTASLIVELKKFNDADGDFVYQGEAANGYLETLKTFETTV